MNMTDKDDPLECNNLFVYGTLMSGRSRNHVLHGLKFEKATLPNHRRIEPPSLGFPFIVRDDANGAKVQGEIYFGASDSLIHQIDRIEGEGSLYHRILVRVETESGKQHEAYTYYPSQRLINSYT